MESENIELSIKEQKELFVTGHEGSTAWEVLLVCSVAPIGLLLFTSVRQLLLDLDQRRQKRKNDNTEQIDTSNGQRPTAQQKLRSSSVLMEVLVLWLPMIVCQTNWLYPWGVILLWGELQASVLIYIYFWSLQRLSAISQQKQQRQRQQRQHKAKAKDKGRLSADSANSTQTQNIFNNNNNNNDGNDLWTVAEDLDEEEVGQLMQQHEQVLLKDVMTVYRSSMLYMTFVAILAVDFHVFPRRFAKTETSGYGLMDLGAASFVVAAGLVSPRARRQQQQQQQQQHTQLQRKVFSKGNITRILPLLALGFVRLATNKGLEYQEHVSEYGVHWNFFFTLAMVTPLGSMLPGRPNLLVPVVILGSYQYMLSMLGWQDFIETAPRTHCNLPLQDDVLQMFNHNPRLDQLCTLLAANREGVLGCIGYLCLYLFGEYIAYAFLWRSSSSSFRLQQQRRQHEFLWILILELWILLFGMVEYAGIPVSRRSTNAAFCVWTLAHNLTLLAGIRAALYLFYDPQKERVSFASTKPRVPVVFQAVNRHGFLAFLVANLLTGMVNLSIHTLTVSDPVALVILFVYIGTVGGFSLILHQVLTSMADKKQKAPDSKRKEE